MELSDILHEVNRLDPPTDRQKEVAREVTKSPEFEDAVRTLFGIYSEHGKTIFLGAICGVLGHLTSACASTEEQRERLGSIDEEVILLLAKKHALDIGEMLYVISLNIYTHFANQAWFDYIGPDPEE